MAKGKVLVLVSSGRGLPLKDGKVYAGAGYYLNELTVPVRALMKEGYEITFANPKGNTPHLDEFSATAQFFGGDDARLQDYRKFHDSLDGLKNPARISDVIASGLDQYDAIFAPGGHGPMIDLLDDPDAGTVYRHFHSTSKPTAVLCHGPISLLSAHPNAKEVVGALKAGDPAGAQVKAEGWISILMVPMLFDQPRPISAMLYSNPRGSSMRAWCSAPVTGLRIGSPRLSMRSGTISRAVRCSMSTSNSISAKMGSCTLVKVVEKTCQTVAPGSVSWPEKIRSRALRWTGVAR
jgi:putative intracellular protease/amidase